MKQKIFPNVDAAVADIPSGASIFFGGFGGAGFSNNLINALLRQGAANLTAISNNCGSREGELGILFKRNRVRRVIASFSGQHATLVQVRDAAVEIERDLVPQGIRCERI